MHKKYRKKNTLNFLEKKMKKKSINYIFSITTQARDNSLSLIPWQWQWCKIRKWSAVTYSHTNPTAYLSVSLVSAALMPTVKHKITNTQQSLWEEKIKITTWSLSTPTPTLYCTLWSTRLHRLKSHKTNTAENIHNNPSMCPTARSKCSTTRCFQKSVLYV